MKRVRSAPAIPGAVEIAPRHWRLGGSLPTLLVTPPPDGWTLEAAAEVARQYGKTHALGRPGAASAFRALADHFDPSLRRAEIRARFAGPDPLGYAP